MLSAGSFSEWLARMEAALESPVGTDVPCGSCVACCSSSQFIHIGPDETETLRRVPAALVFAAPRMPRGHVLMGYDEHGRCPMLIDGLCSIYEHRPATCRTYDCRVFAAAELTPTDEGKDLIAQQVARWRFDHDTETDVVLHAAVAAAAVCVAEHRDALPVDERPSTTTQLAVTAVRAHRAFVGASPTLDEVLVELRRRDGAE